MAYFVRLRWCVAAAVWVSASQAAAQSWLPDRAQTQGPGVRLGGDWVLHAGVGVEAGFDSNVFYNDGDGDTVVNSGVVRSTTTLAVSNYDTQQTAASADSSTPPAFTFAGNGRATLYGYFDQLPVNVEADTGVALGYRTASGLSFTLADQFGRTFRPFTEPGPDQSDFGRIRNQLNGVVAYSPSTGLLSGQVGYTLGIDRFEGRDFRFASNLTHTFEQRASWRFLPQTAVVQAFKLTLRGFPDSDRAITTSVADSTMAEATVGLNGSISNRISATATVGYAAGFFDTGDDTEALTANVSGAWQATDSSTLSFGYGHQLVSAFVGNYNTRHTIYSAFRGIIAGRFATGISAELGFASFGTPVSSDGVTLGRNSDGSTDRDDIRLRSGLFGEYRFADWIGLNATLSGEWNFTDFEYLTNLSSGAVLDPAGYEKYEAWIGVRVFY